MTVTRPPVAAVAAVVERVLAPGVVAVAQVEEVAQVEDQEAVVVQEAAVQAVGQAAVPVVVAQVEVRVEVALVPAVAPARAALGWVARRALRGLAEVPVRRASARQARAPASAVGRPRAPQQEPHPRPQASVPRPA